MPKLINLTRRKFGKWVILEYAGKSMWTCRCECGKIKNINSSQLLAGRSRSCILCSRKKIHANFIGKIYNNWKILSYLGESVYMCLCLKCDTKYPVSIGNITSGKSKSCYKCSKLRKPHRSHAHSDTRIYKIWKRLPKKKYKICNKWLNSFDDFMIFAYRTGYTNEKHLVRIDLNGIFEPDNCKWSFTCEPSRKNLIKINGITHTQTEWANQIGISKQAFSLRLTKSSDPEILLSKKYEYSMSKYKRRYGKTLKELSFKHQMDINKVRKMIIEGAI